MFEGIKNLLTGVSNVFKWFPIIYKDRDWDHHFFYKIIEFKLKNMEEFFNSDRALAERNKKIAHKIKIAKLLLSRLIKDEYSAFDRHDKKWGELEWNNGGVTLLTRKNSTSESEEQEREEFNRCWEHENMLREQDLEYFSKLFCKHSQGWWD